MNKHPRLAAFAIVLLALVAGVLVALGADRAGGPFTPLPAAIVALVIMGLFAWRAVDGLIAFGLWVLLADTVEHWTQMDLRLVDEIGVPLLLLTALVRHRDRLDPPRPRLREGALGVLLVCGLASSVANGVPPGVWLPGLALLAKGFAFFYLVLSLRVRTDELTQVTRTFFVVGAVIVIIGALQFVAPEVTRAVFRLPPFGQQRGSIEVVNSLFTHPALFGWLAAFLSLFLFARFVVLREWWALGLAVAFGGGSVLSGRRIQLVGLLAGVLTAVVRALATGRARLQTVLTGAAVLVVISAVAVPLLGGYYGAALAEYVEPPQVIGEIFSDTPDPAVVSKMHPRNALYFGSVAVAIDRAPLGAGLGRFGSHMSRVEYSPVYAEFGMDATYGIRAQEPIAVTDTFWPMILGETGFAGLAAAIAFFGAIGVAAWRAVSTRPASASQAFQLGALLVYVEALVRSMTSAVFVAPPIAYLVFGAVALSLGMAERSRSGQVHQSDVHDPVAGPHPVEHA